MRLFRKAKGSTPNAPLQSDPQLESIHPADVEKQKSLSTPTDNTKTSAFKGLGWLDRFLAAWIFLAMLIWHSPGQFRSFHWTGFAEREVRWSVRSNW